MMPGLIPVTTAEEILPQYRDTPIARLLEYHNLGRSFDSYQSAKILVGMCMDNRAQLRIPDYFAFILRTGGVNLRYSKFHVSYAVGVGRVEAIALIAHTNCGMAGLMNRREAFVRGMIEHGGWDAQRAEDHFMNYAPLYEIDDPVDFVVDEADRMRRRYARLPIAPLLYRLEDNLLYQIDDR
jgi:carbonic anhydrase